MPLLFIENAVCGQNVFETKEEIPAGEAFPLEISSITFETLVFIMHNRKCIKNILLSKKNSPCFPICKVQNKAS